MKRKSLDNLLDIVLPPEMILRTATSGDDAALASLMEAAYKDDAWTVSHVHDILLDASDVVETLVIVSEGKVVATASARIMPVEYPGSGYLHYVAAAPEMSGMRLGFMISLAVLHAFQKMGCSDAVLETQDFRLPAIFTYKKLGFEPVPLDQDQADRWKAVELNLASST